MIDAATGQESEARSDACSRANAATCMWGCRGERRTRRPPTRCCCPCTCDKSFREYGHAVAETGLAPGLKGGVHDDACHLCRGPRCIARTDIQITINDYLNPEPQQTSNPRTPNLQCTRHAVTKPPCCTADFASGCGANVTDCRFRCGECHRHLQRVHERGAVVDEDAFVGRRQATPALKVKGGEARYVRPRTKRGGEREGDFGDVDAELAAVGLDRNMNAMCWEEGCGGR